MPLDPGFVATQTYKLGEKLKRYQKLDNKSWPTYYVKTKRQAIRHINRALQAIKDGTYGYCQECRQPIAQARLEVVPGAVHCVSCAQQQEGDEYGRT